MTDYRLHVDMLVPAGPKGELAAEFEKTMGIFLRSGAFRAFNDDFDAELALALKRPDAFRYKPLNLSTVNANKRMAESPEHRFLSAEPLFYRAPWRDDRREQPASGARSPLVYHYVHLWTVPDLEDLHLAKRMLYCSENDLYMKLDGFVMLETQQLVRRVRWQEEPEELATSRKDAQKKLVVRATRQLEYQRLGAYLFSLQSLVPLLKERNWRQLGQFQSITGSLNTVTEFWETDGNSSLSDLFLTGKRAKSRSPNSVTEFAKTVADEWISVERETFELAPYFPVRKWDFRERRDEYLAKKAAKPGATV
jgi:hypothetical protein